MTANIKKNPFWILKENTEHWSAFSVIHTWLWKVQSEVQMTSFKLVGSDSNAVFSLGFS